MKVKRFCLNCRETVSKLIDGVLHVFDHVRHVGWSQRKYYLRLAMTLSAWEKYHRCATEVVCCHICCLKGEMMRFVVDR